MIYGIWKVFLWQLDYIVFCFCYAFQMPLYNVFCLFTPVIALQSSVLRMYGCLVLQTCVITSSLWSIVSCF